MVIGHHVQRQSVAHSSTARNRITGAFAMLRFKQWAFSYFLAVSCLATTATAAELRQWVMANDGSRIEAEFVELRMGNVVVLRTAGGGTRDIALDQLSIGDQLYVKQQSGKRPAVAVAVQSPLAKLERQVARCQTAEEAWRLYRVFGDDPQNSDADVKPSPPRSPSSASWPIRSWCDSMASGSKRVSSRRFASKPIY